MCNTHYPRGAVDRAAEEVVVTALVDTGVQPATYPQGDAAGRFGVSERLLQLQRRAYGIEGVVEGGMDAIPGHFHDRAVVALHCGFRDRVVARQGRTHPFGLLLPQPGAALDIGEQEGDDARRCLHGIA